MIFQGDLVGEARSQPEPCTDTATNILLVQGAGVLRLGCRVTASALGVFHDKVDAKTRLVRQHWFFETAVHSIERQLHALCAEASRVGALGSGWDATAG